MYVALCFSAPRRSPFGERAEASIFPSRLLAIWPSVCLPVLLPEHAVVPIGSHGFAFVLIAAIAAVLCVTLLFVCIYIFCWSFLRSCSELRMHVCVYVCVCFCLFAYVYDDYRFSPLFMRRPSRCVHNSCSKRVHCSSAASYTGCICCRRWFCKVHAFAPALVSRANFFALI